MNKAFSAYRGIYIEKEDLQMELNKVKKEKLDLERLLKEQLQAKELELLQLRSEMDTSQGDVQCFITLSGVTTTHSLVLLKNWDRAVLMLGKQE
ncbi:5-azacytidine-induced protein 2-like [Sinocyclocheilus grahami]|uniref:5-azacytidine-induced protein 2-like n=1 Tax=Sinocyclocheilus grahami TaxID=75366 RepID=UPI0007ACF26E|nr:PREDICTED: 5-azacytidine-induced protein 2-like [Sinocyclocheilus grahami]